MLSPIKGVGTVRRGRQITVKGRDTHLLETGEGKKVVVLLHGLGGLAQESLLPFLQINPRVRLIALDRPGYGLSAPLPTADSGPDGQAIWLRDVMDVLGIERAVIFAHSIAAATALCFALDHPSRTAGLLLSAPFCRPTRPAAMPLLRAAGLPLIGELIRRFIVPGLARRFGPSRLGRIFSPNKVPSYLANFPFQHASHSSAIAAMIAELNGYNRSMMKRALQLDRLDAPTAVVLGKQDDIADGARHGEWLADRVQQACTFHLSGVGHMPHHCAPETLETALNFLIEHATDRAAA